jgi:DNA-directed RNA polymerase subunit H (RpoH/RPB5)
MSKPAIDNPHYYVSILANKGAVKYDITSVAENLKVTDSEGELATMVSFSFVNNVTTEGKLMNGLFTVDDVVLVEADNGGGKKEVGTFTIWKKDYTSAAKKILSVVSYDSKLIYLQKSEDVQFFEKGKDTKAIVSAICGAWGVPLRYNYESISHELKQWRGDKLAVMIIEVLEEARKKTGKKYVMNSANKGLSISGRGTNSTVYEFKAKQNALSTTSSITMEGVVTKVKIYSNTDEGVRPKLEATVTGDTSYGTLQKIIMRSTNTKLAESKKEADQLIKDDGKPLEKFTLQAIDIPWIKKGDKISVAAGDMTGDFYVTSITHEAETKTMTMEVER